MIQRNISLKKYNTFGLDYKAECLVSIESEEDAVQIFKNKEPFPKPYLILGGGSNILFTKDFCGTILYADIKGIKIKEEYEDHVIVSSGAGEKWDDLVEWSVNNNFGGLENLSLIPGLVGATPVQNIGAYGVEVGEMIDKIETIEIASGEKMEFTKADCLFGYRNSIFKNQKNTVHQ